MISDFIFQYRFKRRLVNLFQLAFLQGVHKTHSTISTQIIKKFTQVSLI